MLSSSKITTSSDSAVTPTFAGTVTPCHTIHIINQGAADGFWSIDGGTVWARLPAQDAFSITFPEPIVPGSVRVKRDPDASPAANVDNCWISLT